MKFTTRKINLFLLIKLPAAFITGVRVGFLSQERSKVFVKYRWINQNPFKSMFWAVQGMASELSTGVLVMQTIGEVDVNISMLVTNMNATFIKKATGKVVFECIDGVIVKDAVKRAIVTNEGQTIVLKSKGVNENGVVVSRFEYEWSLKVKA